MGGFRFDEGEKIIKKRRGGLDPDERDKQG